MKDKTIEYITKAIGGVFTVCGVVALFKVGITEGALLMIVGELVDLPYRIRDEK